MTALRESRLLLGTAAALAHAEAALERIEAQCVEWDRITKGESPTTAAIRKARDGA